MKATGFVPTQHVGKWKPLLESNDYAAITDDYRAAAVSVMLENQQRYNKGLLEGANSLLSEAPTNVAGNVDTWDPILVKLVRRAMPNLMAFDVAGVQPMAGPVGLIFTMTSNYADDASPANWTEALFNEADTDFSGTGTHAGRSDTIGSVITAGAFVTGRDYQIVTVGTTDFTAIGAVSNTVGVTFTATGAGAGTGTALDVVDVNSTYGEGMATATLEDLGAGTDWGEMGFKITETAVTAKGRGLKANYSVELEQDLRTIHGLDARNELANILSTEILADINRELIRTINTKAKLGAQQSNISTKGIVDVSADLDGRWSKEKFQGLLFQIDREAGIIGRETRRGQGNFIICSSDVAKALNYSGFLEYNPAMSTDLNVDDTGNTFAGMINGRIKVFVDPYATRDYITVGYRGANPMDAGVFYCPYVPLMMYDARNSDTFQPTIGFKTRYGMTANPFAGGHATGTPTGANRSNQYFRIFGVDNIIAASA